MGNFLNAYTENEVFKKNPFASLDQTGVGQLVKIAIEKGRATRPDRPDAARIRALVAAFPPGSRERAEENLVYLEVLTP